MTRAFTKLLKILRTTALLVFGLVIFLIALSYPVFSYIERDHALIEQRISQQIDMPFHFHKIEAGWQQLRPGIKLEQVVIENPVGESFFSAEAIYVQLNLLESLRTRSWVLGDVVVRGTHIPIHELGEGQFQILGFPIQNPPLAAAATQNNEKEILHKFLTQSISIGLRDSEIELTRSNGRVFNISVHRLQLQGGGEDHSLDMVVTWKEHDTVVKMSADLVGILWEPSALEINGKARIQHLPWDVSFPKVQGFGLSPEKGDIDLTAEYEWHAGVLESLHAVTEIENMRFTTSRNQILEPVNFSGEMTWEQGKDDSWELQGHNVRLQIDHFEQVIASNFVVRRTTDQVIEAQAETLPINDILQLLTYTNLLPEVQQDLLTTMQPEGVLQDVNLRWQDEKNWNIETQFLLSNKPYKNIPGLTNLQGTATANPQQAEIKINSHAVVADFQHRFPQPLQFSQVHGDIVWNTTPQGWQLQANKLEFSNQDIKLQGEFALNSAPALTLDLDMAIAEPVATSVMKQYLPIGYLSPPLSEWLQASVGDTGTVPSVSMKIHGPLDDFPHFDNHPNGLFELKIGIENFTLQYQPNWPPATHLTAQMLMANRKIDFVVEGVVLQDIALQNAQADIILPADEAPRLNVSGHANTTAQASYKFLQNSPLWQTLSTQLENFTIQGPIDLGIKLDIPLGESKQPLSVLGTVDMHNNVVHVNDWDLDFNEVNGQLQFTENAISAPQMSGILSGETATLSIIPSSTGTNRGAQWKLDTTVAVALLQQHFPNKAWSFATGSTPVHVNWLTGVDNAKSGININVISNLQGVSLQLPAPFAKKDNEIKAFQYTLTLGQPDQRKMHITYDNLLNATLDFTKQTDQYVLTSSDIGIGHLNTAKSVKPAKTVPIKIAVTEWQTFFEQLIQPEQTTQPTTVEKNNTSTSFLNGLQKISLYADELKIEDYVLHNSKYNLQQTKDQWIFEIDGNEWGGRTTIPKDSKTAIDMQFAHCGWQSGKAEKDKKNYNIKPQDIRALNFECDNFIYGTMNLGKVSFNVIPEGKNLDIKHLTVENNGDKLHATGIWEQEANGTRMTMTGGVDSVHIDKTLRALGIKSSVKDSAAHVRYDLSWPDMPFAMKLSQLDGHVDIFMEKGYIKGVEPGFGRILSLLNLQNIERRLKLDFSDVFKEGYSFDVIQGHAKLKNGLAYVDNIEIDSPSSKVQMQGVTNMNDQSLDVILTVTAQFSSGLPVTAVATVVNPIVGAISAGIWATGKIFNTGFGNLVSYHYHVTGTWAKPKLTELKNQAEQQQVLQGIQARYGS